MPVHWSENVLLAPTERTPWQSQRAFLCHFTENWGKAARLLSFGRALVAFLILVLIYCLLESRNPGRDQLHLQYGAAPGSFLRWLSWIFFGIQKKKINYNKIKIDIVRECVSATETSSGISLVLSYWTSRCLIYFCLPVLLKMIRCRFFFCFQDLLGKLKDAAKSVERASQMWRSITSSDHRGSYLWMRETNYFSQIKIFK